MPERHHLYNLKFGGENPASPHLICEVVVVVCGTIVSAYRLYMPRQANTDYREQSPGLQRMTGDLRRSQLLAAAVRVFARNGFKGTKTREIAAEAGVNEALLFRRFPTKDDVYAAILQQKADESRTEDILKSLRTHANNRDDRAYFEEFAAHLLSCLGDNPDFLRLI